jgi:hypothetical protein
VKSVDITACCGLFDWPSAGGSREHIEAKITAGRGFSLPTLNTVMILKLLLQKVERY